MKTFISVVLGSTLLLNGCMSYCPLERSEREQGRPKPDERILVTLVDGGTIEAEPYLHVAVSEPSDFVYGVGHWVNKHTAKDSTFRGKLFRSSVVSSATITSRSERHLFCWLSDSTLIVFKEGDYLVITPDQGTGLWCAGVRKSKEGHQAFAGRIPFDNIKQYKVQEFAWGSLGLPLALVGFAGLIIIIGALNFGANTHI